MKGVLKLGMQAVLISSFGPLQVSIDKVNCTGKASVTDNLAQEASLCSFVLKRALHCLG